MSVKVIIKRHFKEGKTAEAYALLLKFRHNAMNQPGYISGETLTNHYDPRSMTVISSWQSIDDWIRWQESDEREANESQLEGLLEEPTKFEIYDIGLKPER
jgi:heme-degrading monooxygenase HmoA